MNKKGILSTGAIIFLVILGLILIDLIIIALPSWIIPTEVKIVFQLINATLYFGFILTLLVTAWYYIFRFAIQIYSWIRNMVLKFDKFVDKAFK